MELWSSAPRTRRPCVWPRAKRLGLCISRSRPRTAHRCKAFYAAALPAGGKDNGKPGLRPQYAANYYGGFVKDPDGNNIEAVCHKEE